MKILVTGCMGFIGSNLTSHLLNAGYQVIGFDNRSNCSINPTDRIKQNSGKNWKNFKYFDCDIRDLKAMSMICAVERPEIIVHLAALGSVPRSFENPALVIDVNEKGFCNVLTLASSMGVKRVVFASSSSVYGDENKMVYKTEGNEGEPLSPYALTKSQNEKLAKIWQKSGLELIGLRFFNVYGPGQLPDSPYSAVIPKFINDPEIVLNGAGSTVRDFTYVDDVCEAIELCLKSDHNVNFVVNVGTGRSTSIEELANIILKHRRGIKIIYKAPRAGENPYSVASIIKARQYLNFQASYSLEEGLKKTIAYYEGLKGIHNL